MALTPNFSSSESLSSPEVVTFVDSSTGTDNSITTRHIFVQLADGSYLVPSGTITDYINWSYGQSSIAVDLLSVSTAANVTVIWLNGVTPVYTKTILMEWNLFDYLFLFDKLSVQTSNPSIINDQSFYDSFMQMIVNLFSSESAVSTMDDLYSASAALDRNQYIIDHESNYF